MIREDSGIGCHQQAAVGREFETFGIFADVFSFEVDHEDVVGVFGLCFGNFSLHQCEVDRHDFWRFVLIRWFRIFFSAGDEGKVEATHAGDDHGVGVGGGEGGRIKELHALGHRINL